MKFQFSKRERSIIFVLILILTGYVIYAAGYQWFWMEWQTLQAKKATAERTLNQKREVLKRYALNEADRRRILEDYRQKESDERVRSGMLLHLQGLSTKNSVRIVDMKPVPLKQDRMSKEFSVSMTIEGEFVDMMRFFHDIETQEKGFQIQEFRFSQSYGSRRSLRCQAVVARIFLGLEGAQTFR